MTIKLKKLGVLGGLSRRSTIECHQMINREVMNLTNTRAAADLVMWSFAPDTIVRLLSKDTRPLIADQIKNAASNLLLEGVDGLMITSDTLHCALEDAPIYFGIPVIQLRDALAEEIRRLSLKKVGFIGTSSTMSGSYYRSLIRGSDGVDVVLPDQGLWVNIDYSICNRIYSGESTLLGIETYSRIMSEFEAQGVDGVVVASPEIALAFNKPNPVPVLHTAKIHAAAAARWCVADDAIGRPDRSLSDAARPTFAAFGHEAADDTAKISFVRPRPDGFRRDSKRTRKAAAGSGFENSGHPARSRG